jgi:TonB family protein
MTAGRPRRFAAEWDARVARMCGVSALGHVAVAAGVVLLTAHVAERPLPLEAYTVEITDPRALGGRLPGGPPAPELSGGAASRQQAAPPPPTVPPAPVEPPRPPEPPAPAPAPEPPPPAAAEPKAEEKPPPTPPATVPQAAAPEPAPPVPEAQAKKEPEPPVEKPPPSPEPPSKKAEPAPPPPAEEPPPLAAKKIEPPPKPPPPPAPAKPEPSAAKPTPGAEGPAAPPPTAAPPASEGTSPPRDAYAALAERWRSRTTQKGGGLGGGHTASGPIGAGGEGPGGGGRLVGAEFLAYRQRVIEAIKSRWTKTTLSPGLVAAVRFRIHPDGRVSGIRLERSSGNPAYDGSAIRAVQQADPLLPPPARYAGDFSDFLIEFRSEERTGGEG